MNEHDQKRIEQLLKKSLPPVSVEVGAEPRRDLWPTMLQRIEARPASVPWFDWALLVAVVAWCAFFPGVIPVLLYHL